MANPMNIKLEPVDFGLELERVKAEINRSENLVQQSCSQSNADPAHQFNMQADNQILVEDKNALHRLNFRMDQPVPIPPTPVDVLSRAEIHALPKDQLRMYACTTTATVQAQRDHIRAQAEHIRWLQAEFQQLLRHVANNGHTPRTLPPAPAHPDGYQ